MNRFRTAHATGEDWAHAARDCCEALGPIPALLPGMVWQGLVYTTGHLTGDLGSVLTYVRQKTGIDRWSGTIGAGILADGWECYDAPAVAMLIAQFPANSVRTLNTVSKGFEDLSPETRAWIDAETPGFAVVHGDPSTPHTLEAMDALATGMGRAFGGDLSSAFLVGGMTASAGDHFQIADHLTGGGVSGLAFSPEIEVATALTQGCMPMGETHLVTDAVENVIIGLDGRPALSVLKEEAGELLARDTRRIAGYVHVALPVVGSDTGDYMVRNLIAIDPERDWLGIAGEVSTGDRILFVRRDPASARADMDRMLSDLNARISSRPRGALYFSCTARGPHMFGARGEEARILQRGLGDDVPVIGFFGNGEISNARLYTYSGVLTLFF